MTAEALGKKFKSKREELGYSIKEVVEKTKVHPSVIQAIEEGSLNKISPVYVKGFIKIYASFLGLDIGDELNKITPARPQRKAAVRPVQQEKPAFHFDVTKFFTPAIRKNIILSVSALVALIIVITLIASTIRLIGRKISEHRAARVTETSVVAFEEDNSPVVQTSQAIGEVKVSLKVKRDCFVRVSQDGKIVFDGILKKGALESWQAEDELDFRISDGSSVDVEVDGQLLPPLSKIRKPVKSLKVTSQGVTIEK